MSSTHKGESMYRRMKGETGFTFMELVVVILIIAILAVIAIPAFLAGSNRCHSDAMVSMSRDYGSKTRNEDGDFNNGAVFIEKGNRKISWEASVGYRVVGVNIWKPTSTEEAPIHLNEAEVKALGGTEYFETSTQDLEALGKNASVTKVEACLAKEKK